MTAAQSFLTCELCHGHGYEQTESGKEECSACNLDGETLREHGRDEMSGMDKAQIARFARCAEHAGFLPKGGRLFADRDFNGYDVTDQLLRFAKLLAEAPEMAGAAPHSQQPETRMDTGFSAKSDAELDDLPTTLGEIWEAALAHAAMYVEHHCVDGEMHADAIVRMGKPVFKAAAPQAQGSSMADTIHGQELLRWNRAQGDNAPIRIGRETAVARKARELMQEAPRAVLPEPSFRVTVSEMVESHRKTYWVVLDNASRPAGASIFDSTGRITPSYFEDREHAVHTAKEWAEFLGVSAPEECTCLMCEIPKRADQSKVSPSSDAGAVTAPSELRNCEKSQLLPAVDQDGQDAKRFRWLAGRYTGWDAEWGRDEANGEPGKEVLVFTADPAMRAPFRRCDLANAIDAAMEGGAA